LAKKNSNVRMGKSHVRKAETEKRNNGEHDYVTWKCLGDGE